VTKEVVKNHVAPPSLGKKVKIFVCGMWYHNPTSFIPQYFTGPPPQVLGLAGKKAGAKQGELEGILKELGYTSDQVRTLICLF